MRALSISVLWVVLVGVILMHSGCPTQAVPDERVVDASPSDTKKVDSAKADTTPKLDPTIALFQRSNVLKVEIEMDETEWDALRTQTRQHDNFLGPNCLEKPFGSPFVYRKATVTINGTKLVNVGIRKKGFVGSIDATKPGLKLKFDKFEKKQLYASLERMTLNNNKSDPALVRQCIAYGLFTKAGLPSPRCNFAQVTINGRYLGVFTHVESVKKRFLARHFENNDGRLYEGTLSDFLPGWSKTFEPKTLEDDPNRSDIDAMVTALAKPKEELLNALKPLIDVDQFIRFWAVETIMNHGDGYAGNTNNFFIYNDPTSKKLVFLPWGVDGTFRNFSLSPQGAPPVVLTNGHLVRRLYELPETRNKYIAQLKEYMTTLWDEKAILAEIDTLETLLAPLAKDDLRIKQVGGNFTKHVDDLRNFIKGRKATFKPIFDNVPEPKGQPRNRLCFNPAGEWKGTFSTTFGTLRSDPFSTGKAEYTGTLNGKNVSIQRYGAIAGRNPQQPHLFTLNIIGFLSPTQIYVINLNYDIRSLKKGATLPVPSFFNGGRHNLIEHNPQTRKSKAICMSWEGTLKLDEFSATQGGEIKGSFQIKWVTNPNP